jgi:hypothetical protein
MAGEPRGAREASTRSAGQRHGRHERGGRQARRAGHQDECREGQAKVDAIAELLTALVQQHQTMHGGMDQMMSKMKNKDGAAAK